ncbi:GTP cyclohydrolase I FolE [Patescibacteria group bacterium]|nr:GTP cyclohydrolase I FolE [Patescibacteria group bacterium]
MNTKKIEKIISDLLVEVGEDVSREGLIKTPKRVAKSYLEILDGYKRNLSEEMTVFENHNYDGIITSGEIDFFSTCEHHLLPFWGTAHIGYIPQKKMIGLSKLARAVDIYSRRLQDQERITVQIANELMHLLEPKGVAVMLIAKHFCNIARGVEKSQSNMKTLIFKGEFNQNTVLQDQFLRLIGQK